MENPQLITNFSRIIRALRDKGLKMTEIAKEIGYTSTSQINNTLEGTSMLSTKAILTLIERLHVNPMFLFLNKGEIFINEDEETELVKLHNEYQKLLIQHDEALKTIDTLTKRNEELENTCADVLFSTSRMVKYYQSKRLSLEEELQERENKEKNK